MRFPVSAMLMVIFGVMCLFLYIGFNYAYHGEGGLREVLWDSANRTMSGRQLNQWNDFMVQAPQGMGIAAALCFGLAILFFVVDALNRPPEGMG